MKKFKLITIIFLTVSFSVFSLGQIKATKKLLVTQKDHTFKLSKPDLVVSFVTKTGLTFQNRLRRHNKGLRITVKNIGKLTAKNFFIDYFLSTDKKLVSGQPAYSEMFHEDVLLKGGRLYISSLAPGKSKTLNYSISAHPKNLPAQTKYWVGVFVDSQKSVSEMYETNNYAWEQITIYPTHIDSIGQFGYMHPASGGQMTLEISGTGFGNNFTNKTVQMGQYNLNLQPLESSPTNVQAVIPCNVVFGEEYNVYYKHNNIRISNTKKHLLKVYILSVYLESDNTVYEGSPGSVIAIHGACFGTSQGSFKIKFGNVYATVSSWNYTAVEIICPNLPPGNYPVYFEKGGKNVTLVNHNWTVL